MKTFKEWLEECEEKMNHSVQNRPNTRVEACQLLATIKDLQKQYDESKLPDEIYMPNYDDEDDEDYIDRGDLIRRYRALGGNITNNLARVETLCVCWDKLNSDMNELTRALR